MKQTLLNTKGLVRLGTALFLFLIISANSLFAASISWVGGTGNEWATAANWSGGTVPLAGDDVSIGNFTVNIGSGSFTVNSLELYGNTPTPTLTIASGATLNVITVAGSAKDAVTIGGGMIQNSGTLNITSADDKSGVLFKNGSATTASTLNNLLGGVLTVNTSASSTAGQYNGPCINFNQSGATSVFTVNGTVTLTPATAKNHTVFLMQGSSKGALLGSGFTVPTGSYNLIHHQGLEFTIGQISGVSPTINFSALATGVNNPDGIVNLSTYTASTFTNYGTINVSGTTPNGFVTYHSGPTALNFINNGTISFNGAFSNGAAILNGAVGKDFYVNNNSVMSFTNTATSSVGLQVYGKATLTNSGNLSITGTNVTINCYSSDNFTFINDATKTVTITSTVSGALNFASSTGATIMNNNGNMTLSGAGGNGIGKAGSIFTNGSTGTLTFNRAIQSTDGVSIPTLVNNGTLVMNTGTSTGINANVTFTNNKTLKGSGAITPGSTALAPSTSEVSPGNSSVSKIILAGSANTLNGKYLADINGVTTAGTDYDQLDATTAAANVDVTNLTIATTFGTFTKTTGDAVVLINTNAGTITGTPTFTPVLPSGWVLTTTGGQVKITYNAALPITLVSFKGTTEANSNLLTWITASEYNNYGFEVQRKTSNDNWEVIGFVKGENKPSTYKFKDGNPVGTSYYRLRQLDNDKTESFSNIVVVKQALSANISVSPNPTSDYLNINIPSDGVSSTSSLVNVFDLAGKKVLSQSNLQSNFKIDVTNLKSGAYIISIENGGNSLTQKIIKQ
jgi:hypothetical protein